MGRPEEIYASLPDKNGHYKATRIPHYILKITEQIRFSGLYTYRLVGVAPWREGYGLHDDFLRFKKWAERYFTKVELEQVSREPHNHFYEFSMTDPMAKALEECEIIPSDDGPCRCKRRGTEKIFPHSTVQPPPPPTEE